MRLWSLHPKYLDRMGLLAVWREALLAKKVLEGNTHGYRKHPQLVRFCKQREPLEAINYYLLQIYKESKRRGYNFQKSKINHAGNNKGQIKVTLGQVDFEWHHLMKKIFARDRKLYEKLCATKKIEIHSLFKIVSGDIEKWEVVKKIAHNLEKSDI